MQISGVVLLNYFYGLFSTQIFVKMCSMFIYHLNGAYLVSFYLICCLLSTFFLFMSLVQYCRFCQWHTLLISLLIVLFGIQVQQAASLKSLDPLLYCNEISADFKVYADVCMACMHILYNVS